MRARVRMYRHGLGDCFLLTFGEDEGEVHVLIDCGVLVGTPNAKERVKEVVADIAETTGNHVHVVVATHEHWDHVSGFVQAQAELDLLKIGRIWMAWTEDAQDELANRLRVEREERKRSLAAALQLWRDRAAAGPEQSAPGMGEDLAMAESVLAFFGEDLLGAAGRTTADGMRYLREQRDEPKDFLEPGMVRSLPGLPDVRVYVLGPPKDERWLKKSRPSKKSPETYAHDDPALSLAGSFFAAVDDAVARADGPRVQPAEADALTQPFDAFYRFDEDTMANHSVYASGYQDPKDAWRRIDFDWLSAAGDLALALDNDTNNTSLVLAFELGLGGDVLLFPADAQVGNWMSWQEVSFERPKVDADDLLARTVFYKVGHHGSHNATLSEHGLEKMTHEGLIAVIPVDGETAEKQRWTMPFPPLLERLHEKCRGRVLRSDAGDPDGRRLRRLGAEERAAFLEDVSVTDLYVDVEVGD